MQRRNFVKTVGSGALLADPRHGAGSRRIRIRRNSTAS
jgi:hypothetical protein